MTKSQKRGFDDASAPEDTDSPRRTRVRFNAERESIRQSPQETIEEDENHQDHESPEDVTFSILSINGYQTSVGGAFYDPSTRSLMILEDTQDSTKFDLIIAVLEQTKPELVLVNARSHSTLLDVVMEYCDANDDCTVEICIARDFNLGLSLDRLANVEIVRNPRRGSSGVTEHHARAEGDLSSSPTRCSLHGEQVDGLIRSGADEESRRNEVLLRLGCFTSLSANLSLGAAGALIIKLERARAALDNHQPLLFRNVEALTIQQSMQINADALSSLSIFDEADTQAFGRKAQPEALTLFGLLNTCTTHLGSQLMRRWFLRPLLSIDGITERHQSVDVFVKGDNRHSSDALRRFLKSTRSIHHIFNKLSLGDPQDWSCWKDLTSFLYGAVSISENIFNIHDWQLSAICRKVQRVCDIEELRELFSMVTGLVNLEFSKSEGRVVLHAGLDEQLDSLNDRLTKLEETLDYVAELTKPELPERFTPGLRVVMFAQLGYLVEVAMEDSDVSEIPLEYQFSSQSSCFFKSEKMRDLDHHVGDIYSQIGDRTIELMEGLLKAVSEQAAFLLEVSDVLSELDCILAFSNAVLSFDLVRPQMSDDCVTQIQGGRHLLYEMMTENYVSNDTHIKGSREHDGLDQTQHESIVLLTGANGSGKSAYVKQIGLIHYMAQLGCYVPATSATLGVVDKMFTRLHTRESTSRSGSAFMIDLSQISLALRSATKKSLLLIDEFGKGTNPEDGAGLLAGLVSSLASRKDEAPRTVVVTHFHEVFEEDLPGVAKMQMASVYNSKSPQSTAGEIVFLYKLKAHRSGSSHAVECALQYGISNEVAGRAREVIKLLKAFELAKVSENILDDFQKTEVQQAESLARLFLKWDPLAHEPGGSLDAKSRLQGMIKETIVEHAGSEES